MLRSLLLLYFALQASAAAPDLSRIDALAEKSRKAWNVPGIAIAIVKDDRVLLAKGYGLKETGRPGKVTADTVFAIGSTTKAFTTAAMAMLADEGKLDWDDPVRKHVEFFHLSDPRADSMVTLRDLVSHRTGLSRHDELWYGSPWSREELIRRIGSVPLTRPFRSAWQYQNIMFLVAGYAAGHSAGTTWDDLIQRRIFTPLGMSSSSVASAAVEGSPDHATPHSKTSAGAKPVLWRNLDDIGPAGSINSSVNDLARWVRFQLNGGVHEGRRLISEKNFAEMHTPQMAIRPEDAGRSWNPESNQISYGMAWFLQDYRGLHMVQHGGAIDGFRANITLVPRERLGIVVLSNLGNENMPEALRYELIDAVLGLPARDWDAELNAHFGAIEATAAAGQQAFLAKRVKGTKPSLDLAAYTGDYEDPGYGRVTVKLENGALWTEWYSHREKLEHFHFDTFLDQEQRTVVFRLNAEAGVSAIEMFGTSLRRR